MSAKTSQRVAKTLSWVAGLSTLLLLFFLLFYVLWRGLPVLNLHFLLSNPESMGRSGGIFPTIVGTAALTLVAIVIAVPAGVGTAIYLTEYTQESTLTRLIRFGTDSLAGVPSIIFGLFGFVFFVITLKMSWSILAGGLTLAMMILPTVVRTSEEAIRAVPHDLRQASFALGATRWQMVTTVVLPGALPGIVTGIVLGIGRSIGETAAVILTAGSSLGLPTSLLSPVRTMAVHFYILAREGISDQAAWGTGAVLVVAVLLVNVVINWLIGRMVVRR
ncbi:MAG TPA: phosphate ABC transporter permease PtsA [Chloroflexi bacterium]|nr:phosphate ABC transporter permease PtsA [Chloroflexota bacterium]